MLLAALLAMATHIVFRDLNIVGSRLASRLAGDAIAALEYTALDAERLSRLQLSAERPPFPAPPLPPPLGALFLAPFAVFLAAGLSFGKLHSRLARAQVSPAALFATASAADPF